MPIISRGLPAFSNGVYADEAQYAVDADYDSSWRAYRVPTVSNPVWLAVDLSSVPATSRSQVLVHWTNDYNYNYDFSVFSEPAYNLPSSYRLEANAAPGGGNAPTTGWVPLA
jgi:hypothetical protein